MLVGSSSRGGRGGGGNENRSELRKILILEKTEKDAITKHHS